MANTIIEMLKHREVRTFATKQNNLIAPDNKARGVRKHLLLSRFHKRHHAHNHLWSSSRFIGCVQALDISKTDSDSPYLGRHIVRTCGGHIAA